MDKFKFWLKRTVSLCCVLRSFSKILDKLFEIQDQHRPVFASLIRRQLVSGTMKAFGYLVLIQNVFREDFLRHPFNFISIRPGFVS